MCPCMQVTGYNPITTGMIVAASILSAAGPIIFFVYYILDSMHYKNTGKALSW
jgi:hypothetical protein